MAHRKQENLNPVPACRDGFFYKTGRPIHGASPVVFAGDTGAVFLEEGSGLTDPVYLWDIFFAELENISKGLAPLRILAAHSADSV